MLPEEKAVLEAAIALVQYYRGDYKILRELDLIGAVESLLAAYREQDARGRKDHERKSNS